MESVHSKAFRLQTALGLIKSNVVSCRLDLIYSLHSVFYLCLINYNSSHPSTEGFFFPTVATLTVGQAQRYLFLLLTLPCGKNLLSGSPALHIAGNKTTSLPIDDQVTVQRHMATLQTSWNHPRAGQPKTSTSP